VQDEQPAANIVSGHGVMKQIAASDDFSAA
jgi:hypothetical protein